MALSHTPFDAHQLFEALQRLPKTSAYWVGLSGGADSTALLHALHELRPKLESEIRVLHVNHGLESACDEWEVHCVETCKGLGLEILTRRVNVDKSTGAGREAEARRQRYAVVEEVMAPGEIFLTAHHEEDQAETLILNLMRGSGVDGLAGMPVVRTLGIGLLARPLLDFSMASLRHYLEERQLSWIEDPSNQDQRYDRNFVRQSLVPLISDRWPGASQRIAKSARLSRIASEQISEWAEEQLATHLRHPRVLSLSQLDPSAPSFALVVRHWLRNSKATSLPARQIEELASQCANANSESQLCIAWQGWTIRGFDQKLWLQSENETAECPDVTWSLPGTVDLGPVTGTLSMDSASNAWLENLAVRARQGGEVLLSVGGKHHKAVKNIFRELGIPPWLRSSVPLLSNAQKLLAVGDFVLSHDLGNWLDETSSKLVWQPGTPLLKYLHQQCHSLTVDPA